MIVVAAQTFTLSTFDFTFSDNTLEMWFFSILLLFVCCLLFVVVVVVWCWCCWCCFYYCVVTSFFLHFWLVKPTPSLLLQKSHAHTKKTGTLRVLKRKIYNTTNKWKCSRSQTKKLATRKRTKKTTVALT